MIIVVTIKQSTGTGQRTALDPKVQPTPQATASTKATATATVKATVKATAKGTVDTLRTVQVSPAVLTYTNSPTCIPAISLIDVVSH